MHALIYCQGFSETELDRLKVKCAAHVDALKQRLSEHLAFTRVSRNIMTCVWTDRRHYVVEQIQARAVRAQKKKKMMCGRSRSLSHRKAASLCTSRSRSRPPFYSNTLFRALFHVVSIALVNGSDESATNNGYYYPTTAGLGTLYNALSSSEIDQGIALTSSDLTEATNASWF